MTRAMVFSVNNAPGVRGYLRCGAPGLGNREYGIGNKEYGTGSGTSHPYSPFHIPNSPFPTRQLRSALATLALVTLSGALQPTTAQAPTPPGGRGAPAPL